MTLASFCRSDPAAALRGLANWRGEIRLGHIDLAAHFEQVGDRVARQPLGYIGNGADVRRDILPRRAVAARRGQHQFALLIAQRTGQAVNLRLGGQRDRRIVGQRQEATHTGKKFGNVLIGKAIVEAHHADGVGDFLERGGGGRAHLRIGRIGADEVRELGFQRIILADQRVIVRVANLRRVLIMVEPVMFGHFARQTHQTVGSFGFGESGGIGHRGGHNRCYAPVKAGARCFRCPPPAPFRTAARNRR